MNSLYRLILINLAFSHLTWADIFDFYIGNATSEGISMATLNTDSGTISNHRLLAPAVAPKFIAFSKNNTYCYSAAINPQGIGKQKNGGISVYRVNKEGGMELLNSYFNKHAPPSYVALDRTGTCLLTANYREGKVSSYKIKPDGSLSEVVSDIKHSGSGPDPKRQKSPHAHSIYSGVHNKFVYAADLGTDSVEVYSFNEITAELKSIASVACLPGRGPRHMCFSKDGVHLYVLNELKPSITQFKCDTTNGKLTIGKTLPLLDDTQERMSSSEIRMSDDGRFIYAANRDLNQQGRDTISVLSVDPSGSLKLIQNFFIEVSIPRHFDITPDGKLLVVAGMKSNKIATYFRDTTTGMLKSSKKSISVNSPMWIGFKNPSTSIIR